MLPYQSAFGLLCRRGRQPDGLPFPSRIFVAFFVDVAVSLCYALTLGIAGLYRAAPNCTSELTSKDDMLQTFQKKHPAFTQVAIGKAIG